MRVKFNKLSVLAAIASLPLTALIPSMPSWAASHREAPLIALDPTADITDVYAFRSWTDTGNVVFIMNVIPAQEPSSGPNYFNFDDKVLYEIHLDTNQDGKAEDIVYQFRFKTEIRPPFDDLPVAYAGVDPVPGLPPQITALDGAGSTGLGLRQRYTVTEVKNHHKRKLNDTTLFAVPSYVGPRTMGTLTEYEALAAQGIFPLENGGKVLAGQRDETFYIDLGATFDTLNFRATPPILSPSQDAEVTTNPFGVDMFSGFNVNTIAIEVPIAKITDNPNAVIGMYASTSRKKLEEFSFVGFKQVARMGNPLINELVIGTGKKDRWNATDPEDEKQFVDFYLNSLRNTKLLLVRPNVFSVPVNIS